MLHPCGLYPLFRTGEETTFRRELNRGTLLNLSMCSVVDHCGMRQSLLISFVVEILHSAGPPHSPSGLQLEQCLDYVTDTRYGVSCILGTQARALAS